MGSPTLEITETILKKFHSGYLKAGNGCWEWQGTQPEGTYYSIAIHRKYFLVHRLSYIIHNGPIPEGMLVCHTCDSPSCVNPEHLFLGTHKDNVRDCIKKGRFNGGSKIGTRGGGKKLFSLDEAQRIRNLVWKGLSIGTISKGLGVAPSTISKVIRGEGAYKY